MDFASVTDWYIVKSVVNDLITDVEHGSGEFDVPRDLPRPSRTNGWHLFYRETCGKLMIEAEGDNLPPPTFAEMSKRSSILWKSLSDDERKNWNDSGQLIREDEDCQLAEPKKCELCGKFFKLQKELVFHEKSCGAVNCEHCGKAFGTTTALKRHKKRYTDNFTCIPCDKLLSTKQALERHMETHRNIKISCTNCKKQFSSKQSMLRHKKKCSFTST